MSQVQPVPVLADADAVNTPAANTAAVVTWGAAAGKRHRAVFVCWSYSGDPTGGNFTIEDGAGNVVWSMDITKGGPGAMPLPDLTGSISTAMIGTLAAGGAGITGKLNFYARTESP